MNKIVNSKHYLFAFLLLIISGIHAQSNSKSKYAPKPLFDDPVYHGAADPVVIYNKQVKKWWMFYTNRRATLDDSTGFAWVHHTLLGITESNDGKIWTYKDTANINYRPDSGYTFWAPDIIEYKGTYHMYLTYVPGIFFDWNHPRNIVHLTSKDLLNWKYESVLNIGSNKVIDANIFPLPGGGWRLWFNNETDGKTIWYADSKDLYNWEDKGSAIAVRAEGAKIFKWQGKYFMILEAWKGLAVYSSDDLQIWKEQANRILERPGKGVDDHVMGGHCDVVVNNGKAYIFYFVHPGRRKDNPAKRNSFEDKRTVIQLAELHYTNGEITCDRDEPVIIQLKAVIYKTR